MNEGLNSIEDIDALLEDEFNLSDDSDNNENDNQDADTGTDTDTDTNVDVDTDADTDTDNDEEDTKGTDDISDHNDDVDNQDDDSKEKSKPTADEKKEFAFSKIRQENSALKQEKQKLQQESDFLKELASSYGYTDVEKFKEDVRNAKLAQEAKQKGIDPAIYKQLDENKREIARLKAEREQERLLTRASGFKTAVEEATSKYNVSREEVFKRLEDAGFTVDSILSLPDPNIVIKGLLTDKILEVSKQKDLKRKETLENLADTKHSGGSSEKTVTLDDLLKSDMEEYKKANYL